VTPAAKPPRDVVNKIFGDELPHVSPVERDDESRSDESEHDRWLRDNIPPHHE
jgi:hypothetical protein